MRRLVSPGIPYYLVSPGIPYHDLRHLATSQDFGMSLSLAGQTVLLGML